MRDVVIGQYYPQNSLMHKLDPRVKLLGTLVFLVSVFFIRNIPSFVLVTLFFAACVLLSRVPFRLMLRSIRGILVILVISIVLSLFMTPGTEIFRAGILRVTREGAERGVFTLIRLTYLVTGASLMTLTTTPNKLTDGMERGLGFLKIFHVPVHEISMMMSIALRFIPILMDELDKIMRAQKARGADFDSKNQIKRIKSMIPIIVPLFVSAIRRADDLATAMEARCYHGGEGRTKMKPLQYARRDYIAYCVLAVYLAGVIWMSILL